MLALAAVGLLSSSALAQGRPGQGGRGPGGGFQQSPGQEKLTYLANEAVQKELELADDQKADLKKLAEEAATKGRELFSGFGDFRSLSQEERDKRMAEVQQKREALGKDLLKKVEGVLLPHQMDRLQEIWVQVRGTSVLTDADIAKQLGLNKTQTDKITEIRDASRREMFQPGGGGGGQGFDRERFTKMAEERDTKILAVLTPDQKTNYEKMKGEAFAEAASLRFGGGQGRGRPGQPGQGGQGQQQRRRPGGDGNNNDR
jgi:hypothetical protein